MYLLPDENTWCFVVIGKRLYLSMLSRGDKNFCLTCLSVSGDALSTLFMVLYACSSFLFFRFIVTAKWSNTRFAGFEPAFCHSWRFSSSWRHFWFITLYFLYWWIWALVDLLPNCFARSKPGSGKRIDFAFMLLEFESKLMLSSGKHASWTLNATESPLSSNFLLSFITFSIG